MDLRVGMGYDIHPFTEPGDPKPLVLGGVRIDGAPGLVGHSDADAIAHAVSDALLGAAGLADLGTLFPATDGDWHNADSMDLLRRCVALVHDAGWSVMNVHAVVNAERPKLAPHLSAMVENLTRDVGAPVNLTPKRGEGIGAVGRAEGIAVWATALLTR